MTNYENLLAERTGAVLTITVNRPKVLNALNHATLDELEAAFAAAQKDDQVRAVLITGAGDKGFVGVGRALEMILTGEPIGADEALRIGLVNHVYESAELLPKTREILDRILARGPIAIRFALEAAYRGLDMPLDEGLNAESNLFGL